MVVLRFMGLLICLNFWAIPDIVQRFLWGLCSGMILGGVREPYVVLEIEPGPISVQEA